MTLAASSPNGAAPRDAFFVRLGTAVGVSAAAALAWTLPAALRVSASLSGGGGPVTLRAWLALATLGMLPMLLAVVVLRGAREGLRAFAGEGAGLRVWGAAMWVAVQLVVLSAVGAVLRAKTHQHALAGVTYAFAALVVAVAAALFCARVVAGLRASPERVRRATVVLLTLVALLSVGLVGLRFARAVWRDPGPSSAAAFVIDLLAFALAALFSSRPSFALRRTLAVFGPALAVAVAVLAAPARSDAALRGAIGERAPVFVALLNLGYGPRDAAPGAPKSAP